MFSNIVQKVGDRIKYLYWTYGNEGVSHIKKRGKSFNAWVKPKVYFLSKDSAKRFAGNKKVYRVLKMGVPKSIHINE